MTTGIDSAECYLNEHRTLLAVSEAIASFRDLAVLMNQLADRLHRVVSFDYLAVMLFDPANNTLNTYILAPSEPVAPTFRRYVSVDDSPAGIVWTTQKPFIIPNVTEETRWPDFTERAQQYAILSACHLPLTTAHRRLGALVFACKKPAAYRDEELPFLQLVANQVALAVENALAFQEIEALRDQLAKEKAYLEEEVRTEHNFGEIVGENPALR